MCIINPISNYFSKLHSSLKIQEAWIHNVAKKYTQLFSSNVKFASI